MSRLGDYLNLEESIDCSGNEVFNVSKRYDELATETPQPVVFPVREDIIVDKKMEFIKTLEANNGQMLNDWVASNMDDLDIMAFLHKLKLELQSHIVKIDDILN